MRSNQSISVSRVTYYKDPDIFAGKLVKSLTLSLKDLSIGSKQILALHSRSSGLGTDKDCNVSLGKCLLNFSCGNDLRYKGESTVLKFKDKTLKRAFSSRELEELKNDFLVRSKHAALSNHEAED